MRTCILILFIQQNPNLTLNSDRDKLFFLCNFNVLRLTMVLNSKFATGENLPYPNLLTNILIKIDVNNKYLPTKKIIFILQILNDCN